jgi:hypothetical protein
MVRARILQFDKDRPIATLARIKTNGLASSKNISNFQRPRLAKTFCPETVATAATKWQAKYIPNDNLRATIIDLLKDDLYDISFNVPSLDWRRKTQTGPNKPTTSFFIQTVAWSLHLFGQPPKTIFPTLHQD